MSENHIPPSKERDEETMKLMRCLFKRMVTEENTSVADSVNYLPEYFLQWCSSKINVCEIIKEDALSEAGAEPIGWDFFQEILNGDAGALQILSVWPYIVLATRQDPKHVVKRLHALYTVTWEDGRIFPFSISIPAEIMENGVINDAFAAAQLTQQFKAFQEQIFKVGLDGSHDQCSDDYGGESVFDVLMGAFLSIVPQLKPELHEHLMKWVRLIQGTIRPPIPAHIRAKFEARKKFALAQNQPKSITGGFDD